MTTLRQLLLSLAFTASSGLFAVELDPVLIGAWPGVTHPSAKALAAAGQHVYVAAGEAGLLVFDVSDRARPERISVTPTGGSASGIALEDGYAFIANAGEWVGTNLFGAGLQVLDVRDPASPRLLGGVEKHGSAVNVLASGNTLLVVDDGLRTEGGHVGTGLDVFDISDPAQPRLEGRLDSTNRVTAVAVAGDLACLIEQDGGNSSQLVLVDLTTPASPQRRGAYLLGGEWDVAVAMAGGFAFVTGSSGIQVIDLTDSAQPRTVGQVWIEGRIGEVSEPGIPTQVMISGRYAYAISSWGVGVVDVSDPRNPAQVAWYGRSFAHAAGTALLGRHLCLLTETSSGFEQKPATSLELLDVSEPTRPRQTSLYTLGAEARDVALSGWLAFVANGWGGLQVLDVTDPSRPRRVADQALDGMARGVAVAGSKVCVVDWYGFQIVEVSDPHRPRLGAVYRRTNDAVSSVTMWGDTAYVATGWQGPLEVVDISDVAHPQLKGRYETKTWTNGLPNSPNFGYVADPQETWLIQDLTDPTHPQMIGSYRSIAEAMGVTVRGHHAYDRGAALDITDPHNPQRIGFVGEMGRGPATAGNLTCVATWEDGLIVWDIVSPTQARMVARYDVPGMAWAVAVRGTEAFVAAGSSGLLVLDLDHPSPLPRVGAVAEPVLTGLVLAADGRHAFGTSTSGLHVLDLADPIRPQPEGGNTTQQPVSDVEISGHLALVTEIGQGSGNDYAHGRLHILDAREPSLLHPIGVYEVSGPAWEVAASGDVACLAIGRDGVELISLSNPAAPKRLARLDTDGYARAIAAAGRWAFVADGQAGLLILDITNPEAPRIVGGHPTGGSTYAVNVSGQLVYVLDDWAGGVSVFDVSNPAEPAWVSRIPAKPERSIPRAVAVAGAYACVAGGFGVELWELSDPTHPRRIGGNSVLYGLYHRPLIAGGRIYVPLADVCCDGLAVLESLPFLKRIVRSPGQVRLDWEGWGRARLQSTTTLSPPDWQDLGVPETVNTLTLPADNGTQFFRLHQP